jgi:Heterokaryon incompatibility protein (HET)
MAITTEANLDQWRSSIPISELPNTFRDAVTITRRLEVRYVWIDALCIIPDNSDDWTREAVRIYRMYSQVLLTVAATASKGGDGGCFGPHSARHAELVQLPWDPIADDLADRQGWPKECLKLYVMPGFRTFQQLVDDSPLVLRGWTFQERALAARTFNVGSDLTFWECKEACIGGDYGMEAFNVQDGFFNLKTMLISRAPPDLAKLHDQ